MAKKISPLFLIRGSGTHDTKMLHSCINNLKKANSIKS